MNGGDVDGNAEGKTDNEGSGMTGIAELLFNGDGNDDDDGGGGGDDDDANAGIDNSNGAIAAIAGVGGDCCWL